MKKNIAISRFLLVSGLVLFLLLDILMVKNAYKAEQKHFRFTRQYLLSKAFYSNNLRGDELTREIDKLKTIVDNKSLNVDERRFYADSLLKLVTSDYTSLRKTFRTALEQYGISTDFDLAIAVTQFTIETKKGKHNFYNFQKNKSYFPVFGNFKIVDLGEPDNTFFYKLDNFKININISAYSEFHHPELFLLGEIRNSLGIAILMFILFVGIGVFTDHTLRKQQVVDQMKTDFINNMTHELKTPLSTLSVVSKTIVPGNEKEVRNVIAKQVRKLEVIIDRVMGLSQLQKNKPELKFTSFELKHLVETTVSNFESGIRQIGYNWQIRNDSFRLTADEYLIETALSNLIDNAIKYGHGTKVEISVQSREKMVVISVSDAGQGVEPKEQKHVFEKFYRIPTGDVQNVSGSGLGLFYVKRIAEVHGGSADFYSQPGKGTTVTLKIPIL